MKKTEKTLTGKEKLIKKLVGKFKNSIELPNWDNCSIMDAGDIRFANSYIGLFNESGFERYELTENESLEIKKTITDIKHTELYKKNVADYEAFEIRRKELGVVDGIIDRLYCGGYELDFTNIKTNVETRIGNGGSRYYITKKIVKAIDDGELNIKKIGFSISLDMMAELN